MTDVNRAKRGMLRVLCGLAAVLGAGMFAVGWLPGTDVYRDGNNCFGRALAGVFVHGGSGDCDSRYVLSHTERVIEHASTWLALGLMLVPGILVWIKPRLRFALLWSLLAIPSGALALASSFDLHLFEQTVTLWPAQVFALLGLSLFTLLLLVIPAACTVFAYVTRTKPPAPPDLPVARVIR